MTVYWFATGHNDAILPTYLWLDLHLQKQIDLHNKLESFAERLELL